MEEGKKRMAVLVGCNYPNTQNELHGCINDVLTMRDVLVNHFGLDLSHIQLLTDAPAGGSDHIMPTGANIKKALGEMIDQAEPGDVLFFHYSGHGTRIPSVKHGHPFRQDEAIVPCDFNLITDVDFRQLVNRLPKGASFTILSDSCHSGGLIDKEKEQIGPSTITARGSAHSDDHKPKSIPFATILQHLSSLTSICTHEIGTHLLELFGSEASLKFRLPLHDGSILWPELLKPDDGILLSGCQANETSADMSPSPGGGGKAYGAFSNAVQTVLKEHSGQLSNRQVVMMARERLQANGVEQHPCLYCSDKNADAVFLWQPQENN
ncbi:Metacaspase-9 [Turnera subulata]|uniref:Metacaspase-9 n=1 Tax=Turnera subulata TaxID=218843 RepID=A0A9Q0FRV2_9ROSI|nr:Metacaspase-9 [Turnera subulata]